MDNELIIQRYLKIGGAEVGPKTLFAELARTQHAGHHLTLAGPAAPPALGLASTSPVLSAAEDARISNSRTMSVSPAVVVVTAAAQRGGELGVQRHHAHRALLHHLRRARAALGRAARVSLPAQHLLAVRGAAAAPLARPQILKTVH